jgi:hypothetical protein
VPRAEKGATPAADMIAEIFVIALLLTAIIAVRYLVFSVSPVLGQADGSDAMPDRDGR